MKLNEIFLKDVTRSIEGVVKADDVDHLGIEVEEYVFTNDAAKGVGPLLEEYTNYTKLFAVAFEKVHKFLHKTFLSSRALRDINIIKIK